jgi:hypothetical protein
VGGSVTDCGKVAVYDWPPTVYWTDIAPIGLVQDALKEAAMARISAALCRPSSALPAGSSSATTAAIDLTPGPRGNIGQVIMIWHDEYYGAGLFARSLTDLVMGKETARRQPPGRVARCGQGELGSSAEHRTPTSF